MVVAMSTDHPFVVRSAGSKCSRPPNLPEAWGKVGLRHRDCTGGSTVAAVSSNANMSVLRAEQEGIDFLKRRLASAILRGDDPTALRLSRQLDRAINGPLAGRSHHDQRLTEHPAKL